MDNLNIHSPASFNKAFEPEEARRPVERFEFHYTPKHGSWLNIAEIEFSILGRQCLSDRIPNKNSLIGVRGLVGIKDISGLMNLQGATKSRAPR
ncbi:MAG: transposase [Anaerolineales bacterium]|nr:transposase [Anaerolineales bacterium]